MAKFYRKLIYLRIFEFRGADKENKHYLVIWQFFARYSHGIQQREERCERKERMKRRTRRGARFESASDVAKMASGLGGSSFSLSA